MDAVIHLAGENIAARRWNAEQKARIRDSRVKGTYLIASTLAKLKSRPRCSSAHRPIGFYGDRGNEVLKETSESGHRLSERRLPQVGGRREGRRRRRDPGRRFCASG